MSKPAIDATCKVLLNFLVWTVLAALFKVFQVFGVSWASDISAMFRGGIEYFPVVVMVAALVALSGVVFFVAKKLRAPRSHRNEILGDLIDEVGSVATSFGSVLFYVAATDLWLVALSVALLLAGGLLFRLAIWAGA